MNLRLDIHEKFGELSAAGRDAIEQIMSLVAQELWGQTRAEAPVDHGRLAGSFTVDQLGPITYSVSTNVEYAMTVHEGRPPGIIEPTHAKALFWPGARHPVRRVYHPGTAGNPYAERAVQATEGRLDDFAETILQRVSEDLNE